jgi:hypothetical protein
MAGKACRRCGTSEGVHRGLCRRCREFELGRGLPVELRDEELPAAPSLEPRKDRPWTHHDRPNG